MASEPKDLVPVESVPLPDLYERKYMAGAGVVLFRDKSRAPWPVHAIFLVMMATMTVSSVIAGAPFALSFGLPALATLWLLFAALRITVSAALDPQPLHHPDDGRMQRHAGDADVDRRIDDDGRGAQLQGGSV